MTNLELAQEIYFALEEQQFDMDSAGFIALIQTVLDKCNQATALEAENTRLQLMAETANTMRNLTEISERREIMSGDLIVLSGQLEAENARMREALFKHTKGLKRMAGYWRERASGHYCQTYNTGMARGLNGAADQLEEYVNEAWRGAG